jgi:hypothetical protein
VVLILPFEGIFPQTPWSKVKGSFWSVFARELGITNEAVFWAIFRHKRSITTPNAPLQLDNEPHYLPTSTPH